MAIYYAPERTDPLWAAGCSWLGREAELGLSIKQPVITDIESVTADAMIYGFHCTLKPPMRLATSYAEFRFDAAAIAQAVRPFDMPALAVTDVAGFLALCEAEPDPNLQALADLCVAWPDHHRQSPTSAELQRRRGGGLPPDADAMLLRWGYPSVFSRWRFHLTLTCRLRRERVAFWQAAIEKHFGAALTTSRRVESICIFTQLRTGAPFLLAERLPLG